jgi:transcriptional regulator with XRE-family HTH domain
MARGELQKRFGRNLRAFRSGLGLSQEGFADECGVHRTYMGGLERGERNLTLCSLEGICERIGVDPLDMLREL